MNSIVWSAVAAAVCGASAVIVAVFGGSHELVLALGFAGVIAAMLNLNN
jgi:hypothetical protein